MCGGARHRETAPHAERPRRNDDTLESDFMGSMKTVAALGAGLLTSAVCASGANAAEAGDWLVRVGASVVAPESDNGTLRLGALELPDSKIDVDDGTSFTFTVSYFFTRNVAVELLAAYPFTHDFELSNLGIDGETDHLPPTLSLQYHFHVNDTFKPYVGAGVNWTLFSDEKVDAPVSVNIDDSVGLAAQVGVDIALGQGWLLNFDVRYINIEGDVEVAGVDVGTVDINPFVYGIHVGKTF
jgi:outer membrane protein